MILLGMISRTCSLSAHRCIYTVFALLCITIKVLVPKLRARSRPPLVEVYDIEGATVINEGEPVKAGTKNTTFIWPASRFYVTVSSDPMTRQSNSPNRKDNLLSLRRLPQQTSDILYVLVVGLPHIIFIALAPMESVKRIHLVSLLPFLPHKRCIKRWLIYPPLSSHNQSVHTLQKLKARQASHGPQRESTRGEAQPNAAL